MAYHKFQNAEGEEYGSFEVFYFDGSAETIDRYVESGAEDAPLEKGWYWWACFPGCLPDGDPSGPFATEQEAIDDAQENA